MRIGYCFLLVVFLITSCGSDKNEVSNYVDQLASTGQTGSFATPVAPPDMEMAKILMEHFWIIEFYIDPQNSILARTQTGRWFKFFPDGTFQCGQWEEDSGHGSWFLSEREGKTYLKLDNVNNSLDSEFEIQDVNDGMDALSWLGQTGKDANAIIKMMQLWSKPTKKQFGLEK